MHFSTILKTVSILATVTTALPTTEAPAPVKRATYGSVVDAVDAKPATVSTSPGTLPNRNAGAAADFVIGGNWSTPVAGSLGGDYLMYFSGQYVSLKGTGYFRVQWEVAYFNDVGEISPPVWSGLTGKLFHVASGGGRRIDDAKTEASTITCTGNIWMGCPGTSEIDTLPSEMQQMWQNEFYYLEGGYVELHETETNVDYNISVTPVAWSDVDADINNTTDDATNIIRYGKVRDTGNDDCPVPQYATCSEPTSIGGLRAVPQKPSVGSC